MHSGLLLCTEVCPHPAPNSCVEALTHSASGVTAFGGGALKELIKVE